MTSNHYLLDTNAAIAQINGSVAIAQVLGSAEEIFISVTALGELYFGAENSGRVQANLAQIEKFAVALPLLRCDRETARQYGKIERQLRVKGIPIPQNDMWIAAIAMQYRLTLLTKDAHFNDVDGLALQGW